MYNQFEAVAMLYARYNIECHKQIHIMTCRFILGPKKRPRKGWEIQAQAVCTALCLLCYIWQQHTAWLQFATKQKRCSGSRSSSPFSHGNYFWSNQRQCIVSLNITVIQISSSQKQSLLFNITDGCLQQFVCVGVWGGGWRGGGVEVYTVAYFRRLIIEKLA